MKISTKMASCKTKKKKKKKKKKSNLHIDNQQETRMIAQLETCSSYSSKILYRTSVFFFFFFFIKVFSTFKGSFGSHTSNVGLRACNAIAVWSFDEQAPRDEKEHDALFRL